MKKNKTFNDYKAPMVEIIPIVVERGFSDSIQGEGKYDPIAPEGGDPF